MSGDRIPCLNPRCRRTAPAHRYEPNAQIVCAKCWKLLPKQLTDRHRSLRNHERTMLRRIDRRRARGEITLERIAQLRARLSQFVAENNDAIHAYFLAPDPAAPPQGLESWLQETGL